MNSSPITNSRLKSISSELSRTRSERGLGMNRRSFLSTAGAWAAGAAGCGSISPRWLLAADRGGDTEKSAAEMITPKTAQAIKRGLEYLAARQQTDGELGNG